MARRPAFARRPAVRVAAGLVVLALAAATAASLRPRPSGPPPWVIAPTASGALAFQGGARGLRVGSCPPFCVREGQPTWALSPDGRWLAWLADEDGAPVLHVRQLGGRGGFTARLPEPVPLPGEKPYADVPAVTWSGDGKRLVAVPGEGRAVIADVMSHAVTPVAGPSARTIASLAWSPDGSRVALLTKSRDNRMLVNGAVLVVDAATGRTTAQALALAPAEGVGWRGEDEVVFAADTALRWDDHGARTLDPRLWLLDASDGRLLPGDPLPPGWEPVALALEDADAPLFLAARPAPPRAPDASRAAVDLWVHDPARGGWRRLTHFTPGSVITALSAGPGGRAAWIVRDGTGADTLWWLAYPGRVRRLSGPGRFATPLWSRELPSSLSDLAVLRPRA